MARDDDSRRAPAPRSDNRWLQIGVGMILGFVWGSAMWGLVTALGQRSGGVKGWLYIAVSMAMIGAGVAAIFGAGVARRRGERVGPKIRKKD